MKCVQTTFSFMLLIWQTSVAKVSQFQDAVRMETVVSVSHIAVVLTLWHGTDTGSSKIMV